MHIYAGLFLTALATLAFETVLTRLLSVVSWYHLAFFAVSTAMLGMTAGAATVFLNEKLFDKDKIDDTISVSALAMGLSIPPALCVICFSPVVFDESFSSVFNILIASLACVVPFYFSGIVTTALLTRKNLPAGRIYASDLIGASLGCLFVLWGLDILDAPALILLCAPVAALAGMLFCRNTKSRLIRDAAPIVVAVLAVLFASDVSLGLIQPHTIKSGRIDWHRIRYQKWNSFSWVNTTGEIKGPPHYWAMSPAAPKNIETWLRYFWIDGLAGTNSVSMDSPADVQYLKYDMVNLAYYFRPASDACVIGVGGGRDVAAAVAFGERSVLGLDVNPIFINDVLKVKFRRFAGLADRQDVRLVCDDARSWLSRSKEKFGIMQMSLIDTWAATGAGAFTLSENGLYTREAWKIFLGRLADDGIFTVTRWFDPALPGEAARITGLASAALMDLGAADPSRHIVLVSLDNVSTILICKRPFTEAELASIKKVCAGLKYNIMIFPGQAPENQILRDIISARSLSGLAAAADSAPLELKPPTDEKPFFFNMLKLGNMGYDISKGGGVLKGNLLANLTLLVLIGVLAVFTAVMIILPLAFGKKSREKVRFSAAAYFSLIGAGFMLAEIALIQKLSVFLGHPAYGLGILLFSMTASAGAGSYFSEKLPLDEKPWTMILPGAAGACILALVFVTPAIMGIMVPASTAAKIAAALVMIMPAGFVMGMCFPAGMRVLRAKGVHSAGAEAGKTHSDATPWYWALNGIFGVLCSAVAVFISIYAGISTNLVISALCYFSLVYFMPRMGRT